MRSALSLMWALTAVGALHAQPQLLVPLNPPRATPAPTAALPAQQQPTPEELAALEFRGTRVQGRSLQRAVRRVQRELDWHDDLERASAAARDRGQPILWIQALGDLDGYT